MLKLVQLKYPSFPLKVTANQATVSSNLSERTNSQFMYHETCYFSSNYEEEIRSLGDPANMSKMTKVVQFPYNEPEVVEKTEEEIAAQMERRKEQGRRLQEMQAKQRAEKVSHPGS